MHNSRVLSYQYREEALKNIQINYIVPTSIIIIVRCYRDKIIHDKHMRNRNGHFHSVLDDNYVR
jgi:hypothetical protein